MRRSETAIVALVAAVQFVNILDFLMVMPMGPDFAVALGIPSSKLGYIGGSYTAAARWASRCSVSRSGPPPAAWRRAWDR